MSIPAKSCFGNLGATSGTGVGFTRNPSTGEKEFYGEFLMNAQGEDVVAGVRTPVPIKELGEIMPDVYNQLREITTQTGGAGESDLSAHFGLAQATIVDRLEIRWPSGRTEVVQNVAANQLVVIREGAGVVESTRFQRR